jgi:hypothetical protein
MNSKAVPERVGVDVDVGHSIVFLDDIPDLHTCKSKHPAIIGVLYQNYTLRASKRKGITQEVI